VKSKKRRQEGSAPASPDELDILVSGVKQGDPVSFEQLYQLYGRRITNYIFRMTGSRADAEDLTQETFVQAFRKIDTLKENRKFQSWLFRIAQNHVYQKYRGKRPQMESIDEPDRSELSDVAKMSTPSSSPEGQLLSEEMERVIGGVIGELPEKYREVFVLSAVQGLSYQEISEVVGRSLAAVKSDIHRARVRVRDKVKAYLGENYGMSNLL
jgi:RNA polymerase sigma-70 factor (ECF subfamily)